MKKYLIAISIIAVVIVAGFLFYHTNPGKIVGSKIGLNAPLCPKNLEGILTYPLMDPKYIAALTPLGNINPPSHTSPVDHIYFQTNYEDKIPMGAPADSKITEIITISKARTPGNYEVEEYVLRFVPCDGLELDFAGYNDLVDSLKAEIAKQGEKNCRRDINKDGNGGIAEGQCYYHVNIPVKAGDPVGWVWQTRHPEENRLTLAFEIWAANYNVDPPSQTNWDYYNDDRYAHIMCPFDLYTGELKEQFYAKLGAWQFDTDKTGDPKKATVYTGGHFVPRNGEPLCGQVDQDITGTIQGMWFSKPTPIDDYDAKFNGGLAFLHNNVDVTQAEISIGGDLTNNRPDIIMFDPMHSGFINREPSEVKADGNIYCYPAYNGDLTGKILVQLLDAHHLKAEYQTSSCSSRESFQNPFFYER